MDTGPNGALISPLEPCRPWPASITSRFRISAVGSLLLAYRWGTLHLTFTIGHRGSPRYRLSQSGGGIDVGYQFNRFAELRMGYDAGYFSSKLTVGQPILPTPSGRTGATSVRLNIDKLDSPIVPRTGQAIRWRGQWTDENPGAPSGFPLSEVYSIIVRPVSKPASVFVQALGGTTFGHNNTGLPQFSLGGVGRLGAYGTNELLGNQYFLGRVGYLHEVFRLPPLLGDKVFLTSGFEVGKMYGPQAALHKLPLDGSVAFIAETFLGPISVGGSVGDQGHVRWYFQIGRLF